MDNPSSIRLWGIAARALSRIWVCGHCGAKVYCGRLSARPAYRCLCGKVAWKRPGDQPRAGRFL